MLLRGDLQTPLINIEVKLINAELREVQLRQANLSHANLRGTVLPNGRLSD
ncbi:MAG TPA: pentapeptide repeat-containing protein [Thermosynechococcus sp. M98_K2018_005]|nr:pentapeptide repeat-containing protein [Thermosynechococcus sp. M98_K2018_005]HIK49277.1 pentapeptide repeat-containing protein [Thermosynechococcus sp. M55_K2018_012]